MNERLIAELEYRQHGDDARRQAIEEADRHASRGEHAMAKYFQRKAALIDEIGAADRADQIRRATIHPDTSPLHGAISGIGIEGAFDLGDGVILRSVYAHVMAPYVMAFKKAEPGKPHPAPWKAAGGGRGFDVEVECALPANVRPTNLDRLNTIWWISSLIRLHHAVAIRVPVVSDVPFDAAPTSPQEPVFWTIEVETRRFHFDVPNEPNVIPRETLEWLRAHYVSAAKLMDDAGFNLAYRALDESHRGATRGSAMLLIWSALEALFQPTPHKITHKISAAIATYLESDVQKRDAFYQSNRALYGTRSAITHKAQEPDLLDLVNSFYLARRCFLRCLEAKTLPDFTALMKQYDTRV
ncbi:MAG: hypothetical protein R3C25_00025 [Hyphomonadaceae bacterium]